MTIETRELQTRLAGWYPGNIQQSQLAIDGSIGPTDLVAIRNFQQPHGLVVDGIVGPKTEAALNALHNTDNSTAHFDWQEFKSPRDSSNVGKLPLLKLVYNLRLLMWNLEGLRDRLNEPIHVNSGFRSVSYNTSIRGAPDSMHMYGLAADISTRNHTPLQVADYAKRCGFSGVLSYPGHTHVDLRARIGRLWYWA